MTTTHRLDSEIVDMQESLKERAARYRAAEAAGKLTKLRITQTKEQVEHALCAAHQVDLDHGHTRGDLNAPRTAEMVEFLTGLFPSEAFPSDERLREEFCTTDGPVY